MFEEQKGEIFIAYPFFYRKLTSGSAEKKFMARGLRPPAQVAGVWAAGVGKGGPPWFPRRSCYIVSGISLKVNILQKRLFGWRPILSNFVWQHDVLPCCVLSSDLARGVPGP